MIESSLSLLSKELDCFAHVQTIFGSSSRKLGNLALSFKRLTTQGEFSRVGMRLAVEAVGDVILYLGFTGGTAHTL